MMVKRMPSKKVTEMNPKKLKVQFSSYMKDHFALLESAVGDSKHFDPDALRMLRNLAEGKETTVDGMMRHIEEVVQETEAYVRETGDATAEAILLLMLEALYVEKNFTVGETPAKK